MRNPSATEPHPTGSTAGDTLSLGSGVKSIAIAIAQRRNGATRTQLTTLTGLKKSTRNRYIQHLQQHEFARVDAGDRFFLTEAGLAWLGNDYEPLPEGEELRKYWIARLPGSQSDILRVVLDFPEGISREAITEATGLKKSTRNRYIQHLQAQALVIANGDTIQPAPELLES